MRSAMQFGGVFALGLATLVTCTPALFAAPSVPVVSDLTLWLDASNTASLSDTGGGTISNGEQVSAWNDLLVGNNTTANDATQSTTARQPVWVESVAGLGGQSAVRFDGLDDGTGDRLGMTGLVLGQNVTAFVVALHTTQTSNGASCCRPLLSENTSFNSNGLGFGFLRSGISSSDFHIYRNGAGQQGFGLAAPDDQFHVYEVVTTTTNMSLSVDAAAKSPVVGNTGAAAGSSYTIGGNLAIEARHYTGDIAEMILYTAVLSDAEINAVGFYLQDKYGLTTSYDGTTLQANGDWDDAASWSGGAAPTSSTAVFAGGGFTATVDQASQQAGTLVIGHGLSTNPGNGTVSVVTGGDLSVASGVTLGQTGYTGTLSLTGGSATVGGDLTDGGGTSALIVNGAATVLDMQGNNITDIDTITFQNGTIKDVGTVNTAITLAGSGSRVFQQDSGTGTLAGVISGSGIGLTKTGTGTLILAANNAYTGDTLVSAGVLQVSGSGSDVPRDVTVANGATLRLASAGSSLSDSHTLTIDAGGLLDLRETEYVGGLEGGGTIDVLNGGSYEFRAFYGDFSGTLQNSNGTLRFVKHVGGVLTFSGSNTYSGVTTLSAGTLLINNTTGSGTGSGTVTVSGTGILGGSGTIAGAVNINSGGTLSPGESPGILTLENGVTFAAGSTFEVELDGTTPGLGGYDQLVVTGGDVTLGGATLDLTLGFYPAVTDSFTIIDNQTVNAVIGEFDGLSEGAHFYSDYLSTSRQFAITYFGGTGNDVVLTAVPEPSTVAMLLGLAGVGLLGYLRRRRQA